MPDLSSNTAAASALPTPSGSPRRRRPTPAIRSCGPSTRAGAARCGRRWAQPIQNVSSRFGAHQYEAAARAMGFNNIELITDRPLEVNFREIAEVKKRYPKHAVIVSLMVETREEWKEIIKRSPRTPAPTASSSTSAAPTGCASAAWARRWARSPRSTRRSPRWAEGVRPHPGAGEAHAQRRRHPPARPRRQARRRRTACRSSTPSRASSASTSTGWCRAPGGHGEHQRRLLRPRR
jgi:hypothetical protein